MKLHTHTVGSGPHHIGLVHGLGADGTTWQPLVDRMLATERYTVTTVDLRGHGASPRDASYALVDLAADVVDSLPIGLSSIVGHSLGGSVVALAVERLVPERAVYLDPGFGIALPTSGVAGRLFWTVPTLSLGLAHLRQARRSPRRGAVRPPEMQRLLADARSRFDASMAISVFRDVAFHPIVVAPPVVPSTILLSDESPAVVPDVLAERLEQQGWHVRRLADVGHDMHLEAPDRVLDALADVL